METKALTQQEMVFEHLRLYSSIEPLTALREYGCYRLGAIIFNLRKSGIEIQSQMIHRRSTITGRPVRFAKYTLIK